MRKRWEFIHEFNIYLSKSLKISAETWTVIESAKSKKTGREDLLIEPFSSLLRLDRGVSAVQLFWEPPHKRLKGEESKKGIWRSVKKTKAVLEKEWVE